MKTCLTHETAYSVSASVSSTAGADLCTGPKCANWGIEATSALADSSSASTLGAGADADSAAFFFAAPAPRLGVGGASGV